MTPEQKAEGGERPTYEDGYAACNEQAQPIISELEAALHASREENERVEGSLRAALSELQQQSEETDDVRRELDKAWGETRDAREEIRRKDEALREIGPYLPHGGHLRELVALALASPVPDSKCHTEPSK